MFKVALTITLFLRKIDWEPNGPLRTLTTEIE